MPSKQARQILRYLDAHDRITPLEFKKQFPKFPDSLLEDLCADGYIKDNSPRYYSPRLTSPSDPSTLHVERKKAELGERTPFRLTDRGRSYLWDYQDRLLDKWFTRSISVLALIVSFLTVVVTTLAQM